MARTGRIVSGIAATILAAGLSWPAAAQESVVVPNRVIYPGQEITADALDIVPLRRRLPDPQAIVLDMGQAVGRVARRTLLPGRLIATASMRDAYLVEPGAPVQVFFIQGSLVISATGVPLQAGVAGDMIRVRNLDSGVVFSGVVMGDGTVRVGS